MILNKVDFYIGRKKKYYNFSYLVRSNDMSLYKRRKILKYGMKNYLGVVSGETKVIGSILNVLTSKGFYFVFVIIPIVILFMFEIYLLYIYASHNKDGKDNDDDKKAPKKNK